MNLKEIRDDVRSLIIEPTPGFRSDAELNRWINQAHQELAMYFRIEAKYEIQMEPGVIFYDAPKDMLFLKGAWRIDGSSVPVVPATSGTDLVEDRNSELKIIHFGSQFAIVPERSMDFPQERLTILYDRTPRKLVHDTDEPEIAEPYHRYLVSYAVMRALEKDEDYEAAAVFAAEYENCRQEIAGHKVPISKDANMILELVNAGVINAAEAAAWLNIPMREKVWKRVEVEEKGMALFSSGVIDKADLIKNVEFVDNRKIRERLEQKAHDFVELPGWERS